MKFKCRATALDGLELNTKLVAGDGIYVRCVSLHVLTHHHYRLV